MFSVLIIVLLVVVDVPSLEVVMIADVLLVLVD